MTDNPQGSTQSGTQQPPKGGQNVGRQTVGDRELDEIEKRFGQRYPTSVSQKEILDPIMFDAKDLATKVIGGIPNNRERAIALTHLQEFTWACEKGLLAGNY